RTLLRICCAAIRGRGTSYHAPGQRPASVHSSRRDCGGSAMRLRARTPDQNRPARGPHSSEELPMKARRVTAIGLVVVARPWMPSAHLLPHETAESRAAVRAGDGAAKKLFRVAVATTSVVPHSRKLTIAGRTEADKRVTVTARTGGVLTELKIKRGMWVKKGD